MTIKTKTVNYRHCEATYSKGSNTLFNLQGALETARTSVRKPWKRPVDIGATSYHQLTHLTKKSKCICGEVVLFSKGKKVPLVDTESNGETFQATVDPKDDKGNQRFLQEQSLLFAVRENHLAVIQTRELSISDLTEFLCWFLNSKGTVEPAILVNLVNIPSIGALEKLGGSEIRGISIGGNVFQKVKEPDPDSPPSARGKRRKLVTVIKSQPKMLEILTTLVGGAIIDQLTEDADPGTLKVTLDVDYRSRTDKNGRQLLREVASTFGDIHELNPEIRLSGQSKITGSELTIKDTIALSCPGGNIAVDEGFKALANWLESAIQSKKIPL